MSLPDPLDGNEETIQPRSAEGSGPQGFGLLGKINSTVEGYREKLTRASNALEDIQNAIARANHNILKAKGCVFNES